MIVIQQVGKKFVKMADVDMSSAPAQRSSESILFPDKHVVSWEGGIRASEKKNKLENVRDKWTDERFLDLRYGMNKGRPTTVIPKTVRPSNKKGVKTYVLISNIQPLDWIQIFLC